MSPNSIRSGRLSGPIAMLSFAFTVMATGSQAQTTVALSPPRIEKSIVAGAVLRSFISAANLGQVAVEVTVSIVDFEVDDSGAILRHPAGSLPVSLARYFHIAPSRAMLSPGQQVYFRFTVRSPPEFGHLRGMVYFLSVPDVPEGENQLVLAPKMGIPVYVENRRAAPPSVEVRGVSWARSADDGRKVRLVLDLVNAGERLFRPTGVFEARRTGSGYRTVFELNAGSEPVLPGSSRTFESVVGPVPEEELGVALRLTTSPKDQFKVTGVLPSVPHGQGSEPPIPRQEPGGRVLTWAQDPFTIETHPGLFGPQRDANPVSIPRSAAVGPSFRGREAPERHAFSSPAAPSLWFWTRWGASRPF